MASPIQTSTADSVPGRSSDTATVDSNTRILGSWPYVDIVVIKDYRQEKTIAAGKTPQSCIRIHMDIPIEEEEVLDAIHDLIRADRRKEAYELILKKSGGVRDTRGLATLKAAFGQ
jgi:hypothetical protein